MAVAPGFACNHCAGFKPFWPLAPVPRALAALSLVAFRGCAALFQTPSGLTRRSSRSAFGGRLTSFVSLRKTCIIQPHALFTGIYLFKRLFVGFWVSRRASPWGAAPVQAFLASSPCAASATSYHFSSSASPPWRTAFSRFAPVVNLGLPVLASGSNRAVKPTCLRQAAYFRTLVPSYSALCRPAFIPALRQSQRFLLWGFGAAPGFACLHCASFKPFWPPALVQ